MLLRFSPLWNRMVFHYLGNGLGFSGPSKRHWYHFYLCSIYLFFLDQSARNNVSKEMKSAKAGSLWRGAESTSRVSWLYVWVHLGVFENNCVVTVWTVQHGGRQTSSSLIHSGYRERSLEWITCSILSRFHLWPYWFDPKENPGVS